MIDPTLFILVAVFIMGIGVGLAIAAVIIGGIFNTLIRRREREQ